MRTFLFLITIIIFCAPKVFAAKRNHFSNLSFLTGCWAAPVHKSYIQESWGDQKGSLMLGTSKSTNGSKTESFEFLKIQRVNDSILYTPYINGKEAMPFRLEYADQITALFVNLENDFPQKINYQLNGKSLHITLSGQGNKFTYNLKKINCL